MSEAVLHPRVDALLCAIDQALGGGPAIPHELLQRFSAEIRSTNDNDPTFLEHLVVATTRIETAGLRKAAAQMRQLLELALQRLQREAQLAAAATRPDSVGEKRPKKSILPPAPTTGVGMRRR